MTSSTPSTFFHQIFDTASLFPPVQKERLNVNRANFCSRIALMWDIAFSLHAGDRHCRNSNKTSLRGNATSLHLQFVIVARAGTTDHSSLRSLPDQPRQDHDYLLAGRWLRRVIKASRVSQSFAVEMLNGRAIGQTFPRSWRL